MADIELVIKIPEEIKAVIDNNGTNEIVAETLWQAAKKGTPLPKGHGRLIDADSFVQEHPLAFVRDVINDAPTIIEEDKAESEEEA